MRGLSPRQVSGLLLEGRLELVAWAVAAFAVSQDAAVRGVVGGASAFALEHCFRVAVFLLADFALVHQCVRRVRMRAMISAPLMSPSPMGWRGLRVARRRLVRGMTIAPPVFVVVWAGRAGADFPRR